MTTPYTRTARSLHWLMALLLAGLLALGFMLETLPFSPRKLELVAWHKWAGVSVFLLALLRLAWRASHPPPPLPASTSRAVRLAAGAVHAALYGLMFAIPLSGWLMSSAKGVPTVWFGVLPLPDLIGKDKALADTLQALHATLNFTLIGLVSLHVAAALKHQFIDHDGLLHRMAPCPGRNATKEPA